MSRGDGGLVQINSVNKFPDTAHFPGSGPPGRDCKQCAFFNTHGFANVTTYRGKCDKVARMRDISTKKVRAIHGSTPSCKYFKEAEQ